MRATCHRSSVQRRYYSGLFSLPHVAVIALWLLAAFLPLLLALGSRDFVRQVNSYREQPVVAFTDHVLVILEGERDDGGEKQPITLMHTTFPEQAQQIFSNESRRTALVQTSSADINLDGVADTLHVELTTPLSTNETIQQATVVVVLDYTLKSYAKINMDVLAMVRHSSPLEGNAVYVDGDLDLHQRSAFEITESTQYPYKDSSIVNMTVPGSSKVALVQSFINGYRKRNYTADFYSPYPLWTSSLSTSNGTTQFQVFMDIRIDPVSVIYSPQWPEIVKHAWIQYYCIFMVVSTLAIALREYLFTNKLLASVCVVDEPRLKFAAKYQ